MDENRLIEIEVKLAEQERAVEELNQVVTDQQARISELEERCRLLTDRLKSFGEAGAESGSPEAERPPHY